MQVIKIEGDQLQDLIAALSGSGIYAPYELHVAIDEGGAKFKINNSVWSLALGREER